jgi:eukaryotic-like serine/threonine-protein kinase
MIGGTLGRYRILEQIGAGGMGVVYRATDTQLGRDVALKVLPEGFARDSERMARFKREAQLLASLNHPGIATVYGLEESGDVRAIAMELVDGPTIAERLGSEPIPLEDALPIARQIAEALEAAHERGIIHRDLKPANVKVTLDGKVKVLDFGLAKALIDASGTSNIAASPTISELASRTGVILGTAGYMSPEQARGKPLDRRTDVWSFGCLLYEMLTGKITFGGDTVSDTIARILEREPDWHALPEKTPQGVRRLLRRCLQKDPQRRLHDIADARLEIEETLASPASGLPEAAPPGPESQPGWWRNTMLWMSIILGAAGLSFGIWTLEHTPPSAHGPLIHFSVTLPPNEQLGGLDFPSVVLSPKGTHLAYIVSRGGTSRLFLHRMDNLQDEPISGSERALGPFFSPDGQWLGFFADGKLMKTSIGGGAPAVLCEAPIGFGAVWGADNTITYAPTGGSGLMQVSAAGGTPREVTKLNAEKGEFSHRWPDLLPGGRTLLFTVSSTGSWDDAQIVAQSLETGERHLLVAGGTFPHYLPTGHLVYARGGSLMAVPFDISSQKVNGPPAVVLPKVWESIEGAAQFSFSPLGHIVYVAGGLPGREHTLVWVDRNKVIEPLAAPEHNYSEPRLSPDGRRLAVTITQNSDNIWIYAIPTGSLTQLTFEGKNAMPVWTRDGTRLAFASNKTGALNLFWKPADGSGTDERLTTSGQPQAPFSWSPGSRSIIFVEQSPTTGRDIWMLTLDGGLKSTPILQSPSNETGPALSPDGRWLAFVSDESGHNEVYVIPLMGGQLKRQVSMDGGTEPLWSHDGGEIFYRTGNKMMVSRTRTIPDFQAGPAQLLFEGAYDKGRESRPAYDVAADGRRFLMVRTNDGESAPTGLEIILEWFDELKRRVPD